MDARQPERQRNLCLPWRIAVRSINPSRDEEAHIRSDVFFSSFEEFKWRF